LIAILAHATPMSIEIKKGSLLQNKGDLNTKIYIVEKGLLCSYSIDKKGKKHVFMFAPEGWLMVDACEATDAADL
jgi:CRP-like cAMP-binding protein